jgi:hypothetical protein
MLMSQSRTRMAVSTPWGRLAPRYASAAPVHLTRRRRDEEGRARHLQPNPRDAPYRVECKVGLFVHGPLEARTLFRRNDIGKRCTVTSAE